MKAAITTQSWVSGRKGKAVWLAMIPALGLLCWTTIAPALAGGPAIGGAGPEGSWLATITLPDGKNVQSPVSYCAGGAMVASDPSVFPAKATAYHGTWMKTGRREFVFTAVGFIYDEVGALNPKGLSKIVIKETDTLEPDGDTYNGKGTVTIYGPDGAQVERFTVPAHAVRIKPE
jgi:hypothetical protein